MSRLASDITAETTAGVPSSPLDGENRSKQQNSLNEMKTIPEAFAAVGAMQGECSRKDTKQVNTEDDTPLEKSNGGLKESEDGCTEIHQISEEGDLEIPHLETLSSKISTNPRASTEAQISKQSSTEGKMSDSLQSIQKYDSDSSDTSESSDSDSEEDSDSDSDGDSSSSEDSNDVKIMEINTKDRRKPEESWLSVLGVDSVPLEIPDISTLNLNDRDEFIHMGNVESVIDTIVTVAGLPQLPAYDLDTLIFIENGTKVLGYVLDVMGPVTAPVYILNMSSVDRIKELKLEKGTRAYCAPRSQYTKYVLLQELMQIRGSDASWVGDMEVPIELQEFSDDEQERQNKAKRENKRKLSLERKPEPVTMDRLPQGGQIQPRTNRTPNMNQNNQNQFQEQIGEPNFRNIQQGVVNRSLHQPNWNVVNPAAIAARNVPMFPAFDPSVPPPNFGVPPLYPMQRPVMPPVNNFIPPANFAPPRGFNGGNSRPYFRMNMPGPSDGNWFNQ